MGGEFFPIPCCFSIQFFAYLIHAYALVPIETTIECDQVDGFLRYLDSLELVVNSRSEDVSANIHNFGVFSLVQGSSRPTLINDLNAATLCTSKGSWPEAGYEFMFDPDALFIDSDPLYNNSEAEAAWNLCNLRGQQSPLDSPHQQNLATLDNSVSSGVISNLSNFSSNVSQLQPLGSRQPMFSGDANNNLTNNAPQPLSPLTNTLENVVFPSQERLLMAHYMNRVVNIFCVIDNAKSPWKTIHLPRVLQCAGELSFGGTTTRIRDALRKSLLSISAFYLSNDNRAHNRNAEAKSWGTAASRYRCDAIGLLKYAVETDLYADKRPKYKEFLATMLSMITINVYQSSYN